jgi:DNA helicase-2/ATP-dependent DNA helicase PcrA
VKEILDSLNEAQRAAVVHTKGPVMVIAGAGSGKTRVLTYRIAYLLEKGADPFNILALTFTNKAAREMKERITKLVGGDARNVWMGTFHSIFARVLRVDGHLLGYPSNFTIYDTDDSKSLVKGILKEMGLDAKVYEPNYILHRISSSKSNLLSAEEYASNAEIMMQDKAAGKPLTSEVFIKYTHKLKRNSAMDFDDLLYNMNILLRDFPEILYKYQLKFRYILVDEYQDTNYAQYLIIKKLAARDENICVVGDDAQSIYAFRGANIQNILNFQRDYSDTKVFKLEQNYRSTKNIVNAANSIIARNKDQIFKEVWTENEEGQRIPVLKASSDTEEGLLIGSSIFETKMNHQLHNSDFAILYRTNAQSRSMEEALRKRNIPYRIYGGLSFYKRKEIKDLLAYFRVVINSNDQEAVERIINYPARGIGKTSVEKIIIGSNQTGLPFFTFLEQIRQNNPGLNSGVIEKIDQFATKINSFKARLFTRNAYELAQQIASSVGIFRELNEDKTPEGISKTENVEELLNAIKEFSEKELETPMEASEVDSETPPDLGQSLRTLSDFMSEVALLTNSDDDDPDDNDKVSLMTLHSAKGLEFPYVYIVGMEENLFPSHMALNSRSDLEEERRLFYVGLTRAEKRVTLSYAESRYKYGSLTLCEPSRFIEEIDPKFLDQVVKLNAKSGFFTEKTPDDFRKPPLPTLVPRNLKKINTSGPDTTAKQPAQQQQPSYQSNNFQPAAVDSIQVGMEVEHQRFGQGKVISMEGSGPNKKATVFFQGIGQKQLLLQFAKLKIV